MRGHTGPSGRFAEFALQYRQQANALIEPGCRRLVGSGRVVAYPDITPLRGSFRVACQLPAADTESHRQWSSQSRKMIGNCGLKSSVSLRRAPSK
jgi:hypothetical protein